MALTESDFMSKSDRFGSDTIYAPATAPGRAGVAIIRFSGPRTRFGFETIAGPLPEAGKAALRLLKGADGAVLDQALCLYFEGPKSFTGEDVGEFHIHGSPAVLKSCLDRFAALPGFRLAEPGEFARRAFENGQMDLASVEGLADLIEAETEAQRRQAVRPQANRQFRFRRTPGWKCPAGRATAIPQARPMRPRGRSNLPQAHTGARPRAARSGTPAPVHQAK
mgnify:CR=1 FL=1